MTNTAAVQVPQGFEGISRDWRNDLREFATVGYDYDTCQWAVLQGRTADGKSMVDTRVPCVYDAYTVFTDSREASAFVTAGGYR